MDYEFLRQVRRNVLEHLDGLFYVVMAYEYPKQRKVIAKIEIPDHRVQLRYEVSGKTVIGQYRATAGGDWKEAARAELFASESAWRFGVFSQDGDPDRPREAILRELRLEDG